MHTYLEAPSPLLRLWAVLIPPSLGWEESKNLDHW